MPYQYRPVLKLIRSDRPRLLIADEVGVGKTIEAGLILKELRARTDLSSVLIICPKALVAERKWLLEMKRFDEHFTAIDGKLLRHCLRETHLDGEWPEQYSKAILPFSLFNSDLVFGPTGKRARKEPALTHLDPPPKFDLVIVDEAHHLRNGETFLHQGVKVFCENAAAVLFLSATPVQLGSNDLYTLLNLLRPDLVIDPSSFALMSEPNGSINSAIKSCRTAIGTWQGDARDSLDQAIETQWGRLFIRESPAFQSIYDRLQGEPLDDTGRVGLIREIEELYTFSGLINRTRRRDIGEFTTRKPETLTVGFTPSQQALHDGVLDVVARILAFCHGQQNVKFMMTTIRRQAASCLYGLAPLLEGILTGKLDQLELMEVNDIDDETDLSIVDQIRVDINGLLSHASNLNAADPKIEAFIKALTEKGKLPNNKALVFSTFRHTLAYLARHVEHTGLRYGIIHGSVPDDERTDLRRRFSLAKDQPEALDVLLSSEVGCEGLDIQFCDFLSNYDLSWNPMRIEQR
ncbi:MAG: SNF2-related protein, partial [Armatimonadota bacterium]